MLLGGPPAANLEWPNMVIDAGFEGRLSEISTCAKALKSSKLFQGVWVPDTTNDPFLLSAEFARETDDIRVGTNIAVAFARSPYALAQTAYNLQELSKGRFFLGLGTQVKAHISKRFCMEWPNKPVACLKEYVALLRHLFACFESRERPNFRGEFYRCTLNSPVFTPDKHNYQAPKIGFAAVGPGLTKAAGATADMVFLHPFTHLNYIHETSLPALNEGALERDSALGKIEVIGSAFCLATDSPTYSEQLRAVLGRLAFYASTPNYAKVVESLGLHDLHGQLHELSRKSEWTAMAQMLPREFVEACVVQAPKAELYDAIQERFSEVYDRVVVDPTPFQ